MLIQMKILKALYAHPNTGLVESLGKLVGSCKTMQKKMKICKMPLTRHNFHHLISLFHIYTTPGIFPYPFLCLIRTSTLLCSCFSPFVFFFLCWIVSFSYVVLSIYERIFPLLAGQLSHAHTNTPLHLYIAHRMENTHTYTYTVIWFVSNMRKWYHIAKTLTCDCDCCRSWIIYYSMGVCVRCCKIFGANSGLLLLTCYLILPGDKTDLTNQSLSQLLLHKYANLPRYIS